MRVCSVYIMGFFNRDEHLDIADKVIREFKKTRTRQDEAYKPQLYLVDKETEEAVRFALERTDRPRPDYVVSIGTDITVILKKLYTEITPIPTICVCPMDPIGNGIIDSFKRPGGWISGVVSSAWMSESQTILDTNIQSQVSYEGSQDIFKWMLPYFTKILIPYDTELTGADSSVKENEARATAAELTKLGFEPILKKLAGDEKIARFVYENIGQVHAVASFAVSELAERNIAYWCGIAQPKRLLISSNGDRGLRHGAALAMRMEKQSYIYQQVVAMVRNGWYERVWPGVQPVISVSQEDFGRTMLLINQFMLPPLPNHIMEAMRNTPNVIIQNCWPYHPMNNIMTEQQEPEQNESDDKKKE